MMFFSPHILCIPSKMMKKKEPFIKKEWKKNIYKNPFHTKTEEKQSLANCIAKSTEIEYIELLGTVQKGFFLKNRENYLYPPKSHHFLFFGELKSFRIPASVRYTTDVRGGNRSEKKKRRKKMHIYFATLSAFKNQTFRQLRLQSVSSCPFALYFLNQLVTSCTLSSASSVFESFHRKNNIWKEK